jgi:hypothetical protein
MNKLIDCVLFSDDAVSILDHIVSDDKKWFVIDETERICKVLSQPWPGETQEDHRKHLSQYSKSPVLNPGSSKYGAQVLPTWLWQASLFVHFT